MLRSIFAIIVSLGLHGFTAASISGAEPFRPTISVTGTAEIRVAPDEVMLEISVESREQEVEKAIADNDEKIRSVIRLLKESGVEAKNIRTELINLTPIFPERGKSHLVIPQHANQGASSEINDDPFGGGDDVETSPLLKLPVPVGYLAKRDLSVRITQLDEFEKIYRGVIKSGVNSVEGVRFQTSKLREYRDQARLQAVKAAREKAAAMAKELDCHVAAVDRVVEDGGHRYGRMQNRVVMDNHFGDAESDSLATGMMEITASVQVVFLLSEVEFEE